MKAWQGLQTGICKLGASSVTTDDKGKMLEKPAHPSLQLDLISSLENKGVMGFNFSLWVEQTCVSVSFGEI